MSHKIELSAITYTFTTPVGCLSLRPYVYRNVLDTLGYTFFLWGAQLEVGSNATSYIPTVASAVTRNADVISKTGISDLIGQTEGTLFVDSVLLPSSSANLQIYILDDGSLNNRIRVVTAADSRLRFLFQLNGNIVQYAYIHPTNITTPTRFKIAIAYKSNDIAVFINGILVNSSTNALTISNPLSRFILGEGSGAIYQSTNSAILFRTRLTDQQCINLTTI